jgi:hypothetical protein
VARTNAQETDLIRSQVSAASQEEGDPKPSGYCHNDAVPVDDGKSFCSEFCRREWHEQREAGKYAAGR